MASIDGRNPISSIKGIATEDNTLFLLSDRFASLNFDGIIPRDNTFVYASDLTIGQTIFSSDPTARDNSFFITRIDTEAVTVESIDEIAYSLYFLGENDLEEKYTYGAENENGSFSQNHLFNVYKDNISDISLGNNGWMITNQGNAVFSNVFVRGTIEATSGKIDGILKVGESKNGYPLVTLGRNIFNSAPFDGSTSEHSGLFLNKNNYLMGYDVPTNVYVTSIIATNSTEDNILRKATFTLASHTLAVNDLVSISGFAEDKFLELDNVFPVKEITTDTFTVYYKNEIAGTTNPISVNLKAQSFALNNIYAITSLSLSQVTTAENTSSLKVYFNGNYTGLFTAGQIIDLNSILNTNLNINGQYQIISVTEVVGEDNDYLTIQTPRVTAGTYTTDLGQITLYDTNYKFKVGDNDNSMSYNSYTGALTVTGTINASSGNFTNAVTIGKPNLSYSVSNKQLTTNEAILTTSTVHSFVVGDIVTISGVDATFNGTYTVKSVPTGNIFIYDKTATNVASTAVSPVGTVSRGVADEGTIFVGYGTNQITINGTGADTTSAIYAGAGNYNNVDTGFFMDASGRFSLKDKLTFTGGNLTVSGTINASAGNFTNTVTIGQSSTQGKLQVGTGTSFFEIIGTNNIGTTAIKTNNSTGYNTAGVWIGADGKFSLGNNQLYFDGANLFAPAITTTSLTVGTSPNQMIMSPTAIPGSPSVPGLYMTKTKDFISATTGNFSLGQTGLVWDGTTLNVNGILTGYINQTYAAPIIPANTMGVGAFKNFTNISGTLSGTTLTLSEADRLKLSIGSTLTKVSGTGVFGTSTVVESILSSTEVKINPTATTNGAIVFNSNNAADGIYGTGLKINQYNYWFADSPGPRIRVGDATNYLQYGSGNLTVTGQINATSGYIGGSTTGWLIQSDLLSNSSVGFFAPASTSSRENLLWVPSFSAAGWWIVDLGGTTAGPVSTQKRSGNTSFLIYAVIQTVAGVTSPAINVTAGKIYAMSAYGLAQATPVGTKTLAVEISWYNSSNALISTAISSQASLNTSTWSRASIAQAAPAGSTTAKVRVVVSGGTSFGSDRYFIDDALFEEQVALTPIGEYFDGNTNDAVWTGSINYSTSKISPIAIYAGSSTKESAPFRVTYAGVATMTNANITGKLSSGTGLYQVALGNSAYNPGLDGIKLNSNNAWYIYDDTYNASFAGKSVFMVGGPNGINYSESAGTLTIGVDAEFSGSLSAATGTFSGSLSAATGTFAGSLSAATGSFTGSVTATSGTIGGWSISSTGLTTESSNIGFKTNSTGKSIVKTGNAAALSTTITLNNTTGLSAGMVVSVSGTAGLTYTPAATVITTVVNSTQIVVSKPTFIAITNLNITFWYPYIWSGGTIGTSSSTGMAGFQVYGNGTIMVNDIAVQPGTLDVAFNSGISTNTGTGSDIGITLIKRPYTTTSTNNFYLACYNGTSYIGGILDGAGNGVLTYATFLGTHYSEISPYYDYSAIPLGTVLESVDDLVEIKFTQQERLPKAKISDTYGSKKVYGVFMGIDDSQDENRDYLPDGIHVASVGAGWVRISESAIVFNGDLLISNGDGTAVAQEDDLIRSSTIGKVTSGTKTKIYEDGSYLVPAVLYCG